MASKKKIEKKAKESPSRLRQDRKASAKLRVIVNGSEIVNIVRAERASAIAVLDTKLLRQVPQQREPMARPVTRKELARGTKRGKLARVPEGVRANVFIQLLDPGQKVPSAVEKFALGRRQDLVAASLPLDELDRILEEDSVTGVELGERVTFSPPRDVQPVEGDAAMPPDAERTLPARHRGEKKSDVLVGIIDVQGFDFSHPDFLDTRGKTRFVTIWDQGGETRPPPGGELDYGAELLAKHLNAAIAGSRASRLPPYLLEPQSQMTVESHGTHVASIAAGNHGLCPDAKIAGVVIRLPKEDEDRRRSFYDSTRIAQAVDYLLEWGRKLGLPVSINVSLGTNGHAHDGLSGVSRWIDHALSTPGRAVTVAAGNAGQEAPIEPGDWGFMLGRIHTEGRLQASGLTRDVQWIVMGDGVADLSENELEVWYAPQDRFDVLVRPPSLPGAEGPADWIGPLRPGEFIENQMLSDGTFVSIYNDLYHPANGSNTISVFLSPFLSDSGVVGVRAGTWTIRLVGREVRDGSYHGWIERDDPRRLGPVGMVEAWSFPSFFSRLTNVDRSSVSSLACGQRVVSVANLDSVAEVIHVTSSQGPTRDGREKPEIAAPGTSIAAASGFDPEKTWVRMTGTSMASPYVAGVAALMLQVEPKLTAAQIGGILRRTAKPLPGIDFQWRDDAGYGRIDAIAAIEEAARIFDREDRTPK